MKDHAEMIGQGEGHQPGEEPATPSEPANLGAGLAGPQRRAGCLASRARHTAISGKSAERGASARRSASSGPVLRCTPGTDPKPLPPVPQATTSASM